jgi:hypothetical protein
MIVIARVKSVSQHVAIEVENDEDDFSGNPFGLEPNETYF